MIRQKITIVTDRITRYSSLNEELQWFAHAIGLFGERDRDRSCFRLFIELVKAAKREMVLTSDELGKHLGLSRGTVVHHLHTLNEKGLLIRVGKGYALRANNFVGLIEELKKDVNKAMNQLHKTAEELDELLEL